MFLLPFYVSLMSGEADEVPQPVLAPGIDHEGAACIEDAEEMRAEHMKMLIEWRRAVVRGADREYVSSDGTIYDKSLTDTCLEQCHTNKSEFCDQCHDYASVEPGCWSCHNIVEGD